MVDLSKQQKAIERALAEINPLNAGRKRDETLALLRKFFPKAEAHMGQVKKYKATPDYLTQENAELKSKVNASKQGISSRLEANPQRLHLDR